MSLFFCGSSGIEGVFNLKGYMLIRLKGWYSAVNLHEYVKEYLSPKAVGGKIAGTG